MPPIPIHRNDPIHPVAAQPDGITIQTADNTNPPPTRTTPAQVPATKTADISSPPSPQPGAHPVAAIHRSWHTSQVFHGNPRPATAA